MKLVEVIKADHTSQETVDTLVTVGRKMGKVTVNCNDTPGYVHLKSPCAARANPEERFIVGRLLIPYMRELVPQSAS